jgi:hypothetical protein
VAIAVIQDFDGATIDEYDIVVEKMGITSGGKHSDPGCLFHWAAQTAEGVRIVDVWETREQFDKFIEAQVVPDGLEVGFPNPPKNTFYEVHAYFT